MVTGGVNHLSSHSQNLPPFNCHPVCLWHCHSIMGQTAAWFLTVSEIKKKKSCQPMCQTALPFHYSFLLPAVLFICLDPGNVLLLHRLTLLQHFFFQGFKRQAGQPGMLRQLAGPLRQIKKKKRWVVHIPASCTNQTPDVIHTQTHTHTQSFCTNDWVVCVWSSCLLCVVFSSLLSAKRVGKSQNCLHATQNAFSRL